ncbi:MAG: hypothetical protein IKQ94_05675 [Bacteroidales bacterium]|nr:hypothetical protein [Bacteroidales bacterium]
MKTSYKILIGVGVVVALYIVWELFLALKDSSSGSDASSGDASDLATSDDDYSAYLQSQGLSADGGASSGNSGNKSGGVKISTEEAIKLKFISDWRKVSEVFSLPFTWPKKVYDYFSEGSDSSTASSKKSTSASTGTIAANYKASEAAKTASNFPIRYGSNNEAVRQLQRWLNKYISAGISDDGIYGNQTGAALALLEKKMMSNNLSSKISQIMTKTSDNRYTISQGQFQMLEAFLQSAPF